MYDCGRVGSSSEGVGCTCVCSGEPEGEPEDSEPLSDADEE